MVTLKNESLAVRISPHGAELQSVLSKSGTEFLWNGDPAFWAGRAPLLFPICGGLKDDHYYLDGREYTLKKHGFARGRDFEVEKQTESSVCFLLCADSETLEAYPYRFELRACYTLAGASIQVEYRVTNRSDKNMYFSIGAHEAYACPEGIEAYDVIFPRKETLASCVLEGNLLGHRTVPILNNSDTLPLKYDYFSTDALVFKGLKSRSAVLRNRETGRSVHVEFEGFGYFLLWTKPKASYICIEPWCGIPDSLDTDQGLTHKEGIQCIAPEGTFRRIHTMAFSEG